MKKHLLTLMIVALALSTQAQSGNDTIAQPSLFVGRRLNASGEVIKEYNGSFSYSPEGKLKRFNFPQLFLNAVYGYEGDFLSYEWINHSGGYPQLGEDLTYRYYDDGKIKSIFHAWDAMNSNECWIYTYDDSGRLVRKDYGVNSANINNYILYEYHYSDEGMTRIASSYIRALQGYQFVWAVNRTYTSQYSPDYMLLSERTDAYNYEGGGELIASKLVTYSYTPSGKEEETVTQTLTDGEWVNTSIKRYVYNDFGRVIEQQNGVWSQEDEDWNINRKVEFALSDDRLTYTVTFLKKSGENWVWDVFYNQTLFFESQLKEQQRALGYFVFEDMCGSANINQFEFQMRYTQTPIYMDAKDHSSLCYAVYPNPGKETVCITAPVENTVVRVYDMQGRLLLAKPFDFNISINTSDWAPGVYLWEIWNGTQKEAVGKWVKE